MEHLLRVVGKDNHFVKVVRPSLTGMAGMHSIGNSQPPRRAEREPLQLYLIVSTALHVKRLQKKAGIWLTDYGILKGNAIPPEKDDSILATSNCFNPAEFLSAEILLCPQNSIV